MTTDPITLTEMAQAYAEACAERDAAQTLVAKLYGPYKAARDVLSDKQQTIKQMEQAMGGVKQTDAIRRALVEADLKFDGPLVIATKVYKGHHLYCLAAIGSAGTGLYVYTPETSRRSDSKTHSVRRVDAVKHDYDLEAPIPHHRDRTSTSEEAAGLVAWQERGKGDFGLSGPYRPMAPPEGGRWRWLKVSEQQALPS